MAHDYMTLLGADDVSRAGHNMQSAAQDMRSAAGTMSEVPRDIRMVLDNFMVEFNHALDRMAEIVAAIPKKDAD